MNASRSSLAEVVENAPDTRVVALVDRFTGLTASITGGPLATFETVTAAEEDVVWLPAASRARAASVCAPLAALVEFHAIVYGAVVTSAPTAAPSSRNCTPATATLSLADADTATADPLTVAPSAGAVIDTVGAVRSLFTVTLIGDVAVLPAASRAIALSVCVPFATPDVFHVIENGLAVSSAPRFTPSSWNWTPTTATLSDAVADTVTFVPATVAPLAGAVIDTVGGVPSTLLTVTLIAADVVELPAASRATAVSVWTPFVVAVVFQVTPYGLVVTSAPRFAPSSLNWTPTTATLSAAFADTAALADTVDPPAGAAIDTVGGVVSLLTVTFTAADVAWLPAASRARAASVCAPLPSLPEFHVIEYGAVVTSAPTAAPSSRNCTPATPTLSLAVADTVIDPVAVEPLAGAVIETVG